MIEVYKYLNGHSPDIMNDIFKLRKIRTIAESSEDEDILWKVRTK